MTDQPSDLHDHVRLLAGVKRFRSNFYARRQELFGELGRQQTPHTLFITCADSRVSPEMITQCEPGEIFVCRNIGNIVPAYGEMLGGVSAVVEYACEALNVRTIVICGHSDCGAMKGLLAANAPVIERMPTVASWLRNAEAARTVIEMTQPNLDAADKVQALVEQNVRLQLAHLRTHPSVAARLAAGTIELHGWVFDIDDGNVGVFDAEERQLVSADSLAIG